jgi:orotidine-5'-phosphate decarboxylase
MYKANEELRARADEDRKRVDIDDTISNAVQSGAASSIIFLLVAAALLAPLVSMCTQE